MQINELKLNSKRKSKKTIGRGGKRGTYSGRGCKGQKARSGGNVDPLFEGGRSTLIDRMKKKKGFNSRKIKPVAIKFSSLVKKFQNGATISTEDLIKKNLVKKAEVKKGVKILGPVSKDAKFSFDKNILLSKSIKK